VRRGLRWAARIGGGIVALLLVAVAAAYGVSHSKLSRTWEVPRHAFAVVPDAGSPAMVAAGQQLVKSRGCVDCHGPGLAGNVMMKDPMFATLASANLTPGGAARTDEDWERAVRHGIKRDGSPLLLMPSEAYNGLSDEELASIVAYARTLPAVSTPLPTPSLGPIARGLLSAGKLPFITAAMIPDHAKPHPARVAAEATPAFGEYLSGGCKACHGPGLSGGPGGEPGSKPPKNLTPDVASGIGSWQEEQFVTALRTGKRPDGTEIDARWMPISMTREMSDTELRALYRYLRTVPAKAFGNH
jgi:mono/diheme cytochrome c family protein